MGSLGKLWRNWGYLARLRQARAERWRQQRGSRGSERNSLAPQVGLEPTTLRLTAECSTIELLRSRGVSIYDTKLTCQSQLSLAFRRVGAFGRHAQFNERLSRPASVKLAIPRQA